MSVELFRAVFISFSHLQPDASLCLTISGPHGLRAPFGLNPSFAFIYNALLFSFPRFSPLSLLFYSPIFSRFLLLSASTKIVWSAL